MLLTLINPALAQHDDHDESHAAKMVEHNRDSLDQDGKISSLNVLGLGPLKVHVYPVVVPTEAGYSGHLVLLVGNITKDGAIEIQLVSPDQHLYETTALLQPSTQFKEGQTTNNRSGHGGDSAHKPPDHQQGSGDRTEGLFGLLIPWFAGTEGPQQGTWRVSLQHENAVASMAISVSDHLTKQGTRVFATFAPTPSVSNGGHTEALIFVYSGGEPVHSGIMLQRNMPGMQHSTDEEEVHLIHDHLQVIERATGGALSVMVNRGRLDFAMAGEWVVVLRILGTTNEVIPFSTEVLGE
jgi:hypothetical protein